VGRRGGQPLHVDAPGIDLPQDADHPADGAGSPDDSARRGAHALPRRKDERTAGRTAGHVARRDGRVRRRAAIGSVRLRGGGMIAGGLAQLIPLAFASGLNVYATIAVLGLCEHYHLVDLPEQFRAFDHPAIIGIALVMYLVEFVADKIPWFDSVWDAVHTV